ncbi:uncharacterized protein L201_003727 [Kwoniella dendrophila CBS 6074]|uniref:Uncharacterized protein n=1 Tax=Kwoniella dendrophila CBS 6074 TaxID=1295534 RepID=A0AAX4JTY1_9TREE
MTKKDKSSSDISHNVSDTDNQQSLNEDIHNHTSVLGTNASESDRPIDTDWTSASLKLSGGICILDNDSRSDDNQSTVFSETLPSDSRVDFFLDPDGVEPWNVENQ